MKQNQQPINDPQLKREVHDATKEAEHDAKTGDLETVKQSEGGPATDLPTGARSHPPE